MVFRKSNFKLFQQFRVIIYERNGNKGRKKNGTRFSWKSDVLFAIHRLYTIRYREIEQHVSALYEKKCICRQIRRASLKYRHLTLFAIRSECVKRKRRFLIWSFRLIREIVSVYSKTGQHPHTQTRVHAHSHIGMKTFRSNFPHKIFSYRRFLSRYFIDVWP